MTMKTKHLKLAALLVMAGITGLVLTWSGPAAAVSPAVKCEAAKLKIAGKYGFCRLKAEAKAAQTSDTPDYSKCDAKYADKWGVAETKGDGQCPTNGDESAVQTFIMQHTDDLAVLLSGGSPQPCQAFPATGQTTAYAADKNDGIPAPVAVPDDGAVRAGAPLDYVDNGDGTITDLNTGLMWEKKAISIGLHNRDKTYVWSGNGSEETIWDWLDDVNAEGGTGFAGHNDWRVPNVKELQSIVNYGSAGPAVSSIFNTACAPSCTVLTCSCTQSGRYWSSTTYGVLAWSVDFANGFVPFASKTIITYVRAVRGGL
ncbi:hypothetical protein A3D60_04075 [Candidatus Uhrbacteria bacterium RIFCSPHIGHO2_02_FULL_47_29]|nr:MAG: hypothetical protein A3D60_04075 [Candidatus Uhrbacteria bacterium RIFCSPHIGHO2_02_FULL_47_29]